MGNEHYQKDFEKGIRALEEIQLLSDFSVAPLVGNAYFYLSEMKRKADMAMAKEEVHFLEVEKVLDQRLFSIIDEFFGNKARFKGYNYQRLTEKIDFKKWNLLLATLPEFLSLITLFNYYGEAEVHVDENRLMVNGFILESGHIEQHRKLIYIITRKLLRHKVLLTFNLEKAGKSGLLRLSLKMNISHDDSLVYRVRFKVSSTEQHVIGFSNVFCQYRTRWEDIVNVGEHNIVEIGSNLSVKHFFGVPELSRTASANKEILHFPFIFRPFSIILPVKGSLDDDTKRRQDVSKNFHTIDFFSLFNL